MTTTIEEIGADGQPNNMFKFAKAKTAADTDGSESKDTFERSGNKKQRNAFGQRNLECTY